MPPSRRRIVRHLPVSFRYNEVAGRIGEVAWPLRQVAGGFGQVADSYSCLTEPLRQLSSQRDRLAWSAT